MNALEAQLTGILSSTDSPEIRIRRNRDGRYVVRVYAHNQDKTAHGEGKSISAAVQEATDKRSAPAGT